MKDILKATNNRKQLASTTSNPRTLTPSLSCQLQLPLRIAIYYGHIFISYKILPCLHLVSSMFNCYSHADITISQAQSQTTHQNWK